MYVIVHVLDFGLSASPSSMTILKGSNQTSTITVASLNRFQGTVQLSATISPIVSKGPTVSLSTASLSISPGGSGTSTLTVYTSFSTPKGTYTVTVTATSGSITHTITITVNITTS
jgi:uncharacterized membrane protein